MGAARPAAIGAGWWLVAKGVSGVAGHRAGRSANDRISAHHLLPAPMASGTY